MTKMLRITLPIAMIAMVLSIGIASQLYVVDAQTTGGNIQFGDNWTGLYYDNETLTGVPAVQRLDAQVNFIFTGSPFPEFSFPDENWSASWNALETFVEGRYRFSLTANDGARLIIDGATVIDFFNDGSFFVAADIDLAQGIHDLRVEYVNRADDGNVQLYWEPVTLGTPLPTFTPTNTSLPPIPPGALTGTVIRADVLNVRDAPSLGGGRVGQILRGQTYQIIGRNADASWFLLQLSLGQAWAYGYYIFVNGNEFAVPVRSASNFVVGGLPPGFVDTGVLVQTEAVMKLREVPDVLGQQTGRIGWGEFLPVTARTADGQWYQVVWRGTPGWVFTGFLKIVQGDVNGVPIIQ